MAEEQKQVNLEATQISPQKENNSSMFRQSILMEKKSKFVQNVLKHQQKTNHNFFEISLLLRL